MPPITTTANTMRIKFDPIRGETGNNGAANTPANAARPAPKAKVNEIMTGTLTPKASTSLAFSVAALSNAPKRVFSMANQRSEERRVGKESRTGSEQEPLNEEDEINNGTQERREQ